MRELPGPNRDYQAEVHFALATVVQAITIAALGSELVVALRDLQSPVSIWLFVTAVQSLLICITFWFAFIMAYFSGFRLVRLSAMNHFVLAATYFVIGLLQFMAIQFLAEPRLWLTFVLMLLAATLFSTWYASHYIELVPLEGAGQAADTDPISRILVVVSLAAAACVVLWYAVPAIDTAVFRAISLSISGAGLLLLDVAAIRAFQQQLDGE